MILFTSRGGSRKLAFSRGSKSVFVVLRGTERTFVRQINKYEREDLCFVLQKAYNFEVPSQVMRM